MACAHFSAIIKLHLDRVVTKLHIFFIITLPFLTKVSDIIPVWLGITKFASMQVNQCISFLLLFNIMLFCAFSNFDNFETDISTVDDIILILQSDRLTKRTQICGVKLILIIWVIWHIKQLTVMLNTECFSSIVLLNLHIVDSLCFPWFWPADFNLHTFGYQVSLLYGWFAWYPGSSIGRHLILKYACCNWMTMMETFSFLVLINSFGIYSL
jgi:hypothetical protein